MRGRFPVPWHDDSLSSPRISTCLTPSIQCLRDLSSFAFAPESVLRYALVRATILSLAFPHFRRSIRDRFPVQNALTGPPLALEDAKQEE